MPHGVRSLMLSLDNLNLDEAFNCDVYRKMVYIFDDMVGFLLRK